MLPTRVANRRSTLARRVAEPGWIVLPLRVFLGATFVYAGLQKLADKHFFDASSPSSIQAQLHAYARSSPVGGVLSVAGHAAVLFGLLIAVGELAVGLGALTGLWTRLAAAGGALLSLSFLLSVSWHARPFYYGADIVFLVAWLPLILVGSGGVLSLDARLRQRSRTDLNLPPAGPVSIEFAAVRRLCGAYEDGACALRHRQPCAPELCPVLLAGPGLRPAVAATLNRRDFLRRGQAAAVLAAGATALGVLVAVVGRLVPSSASQTVTLTPNSGGNPLAGSTSTASPVGGPAGSSGAAPSGSAAAPSGSAAAPSGATAPATGPTAAPPATAAPTTGPRPTAPPATGTPPTAPRPTAPPAHPPGTAIGAASAVPAGAAASFTDPATGNPAYVLRNANGTFRAFSAVCTHSGCTVAYSGSRQAFVCPCHGAQFNGVTGAVLQGPARSPLPAIAVAEGADGQLYAT